LPTALFWPLTVVPITDIEPSRQIAAVSELFLRANGQDKYDVYLFHVAIERHIAAGTTSDYEFPEASSDGSSNQGVLFENIDRTDHLSHARGCICYVMCEEMLQNAIEVFRQLWSKLDSRHA